MAAHALDMPVVVHPVDKEVELRLGMDFASLTAAYCRWHGEGLFSLIFHRCPDIGLWEWLDWNYSPTVEPVGCYAGGHLVGIGWICKAFQIGNDTVAEVGAAFFRRTPLSVWHRALDLFMAHAFVDRGFGTICGLSARENRAAREILRYCGMVEADHLPWGEVVEPDTMIYKLERNAWRGLA